ncbi:hypothetical protein [Fusobacterium mortiferum]|uniref:DUF4491 family protein n=1 Tax=Fusobacterium mortiferum TaxID=850 RepID=A0ABS2G686_FUSMR|nr:hypothetical protein [Fusobacterium mortiferum]MBM6876083.1 hypothetical protein [Fusobacterium mortiferum]
MTKVWITVITILGFLSTLEVLHIRANFFKRPFKEGAKDYIDSFKLKVKKGEDEDANQ